MANHYREEIIDIELNSGSVHRSWLNHAIGLADSAANRFGVRLFRDGEAVAIGSATCQGYFRNSQGTNIALTSAGTVSGNVAYVTLPQACYDYEGPFTLAIKIVGGGVTGTMRIIDGMVDNTNTTSTVAPTGTVPTYQEVLSVFEQAEAVVEASVRYDTTQSLTDAQKTTARGNIEAASEDDVTDLKSALNPDNAVSILSFVPGKSMSSNGIDYTWGAGKMILSGTAVSGSVGNIIADADGYGVSLPDGVAADSKLYVKANGLTSTVRLNITFFNSSTTALNPNYYLTESGTITVPATANKMRVRIYVTSGTAISGSKIVEVSIVNSLTNKELKNYADDISEDLSDFQDVFGTEPFIKKTVLESGTDIDTVIKSGWYWLTSGNTYTHIPTGISGEGALLIVYAGTDIPVQLMIGANTGVRKIYTRSGRSNSFIGRDWIDMIGVFAEKTDLDNYIENALILPSGDLNDLSGNICVLLSSDKSYSNKPFDIGAVFNLDFSSTLSVQFGYQFTTGKIHYRRKSTTWGSWIDLLGVLAEKSELENYIENVKVLPSGDLNDLSDNSCSILISTNEYTHYPFTLGVIYNLVFSSTLSIQFGYQFTTGELFYRRKSTTWGEWKSLTPYIPYKSGAKYVAFGDSLSYGAVWSPEQGTALHRVKNEWRIPTRIALAAGMISNYANEAIGGIGYLKEEDGLNIVSQISNYTFTNVEIVTIMAGANDKSTISLGTYNDTASTNSICGAIRNIIQTIASKNPKTQIVIIQPPPSGVDGNEYDVWSYKPSGWKWTMNEFDTQVSQLCHDEHVGYVNWWDSTICRNWKYVGYNGSVGPNYTHPTADFDYCMLGDFIAGKVSALFRGMN